MGNPVTIIVQAQTAEAAAAVKAFCEQGAQGLKVLEGASKAASESMMQLREASMLTREGFNSMQGAILLLGGGKMAEVTVGVLALSDAMRTVRTASKLTEISLPVMGTIAGVIALAVAGGVYAWHEWNSATEEAAQKAKDLTEAFKELPGLLKQIADQQKAGILGPASAAQYADYLTGRKKLYLDQNGQITKQATHDEQQQQFETVTMGGIMQQLPISSQNVAVPNQEASQAQSQKWVQDQITANGQITSTQVDALDKLKDAEREAHEARMDDIQKEAAEYRDSIEKRRHDIENQMQIAGANEGQGINALSPSAAAAAKKALVDLDAAESQGLAKIADKGVAQAMEVVKQYNDFLGNMSKTIDEMSRKAAEEDARHQEQLEREMQIQQQISRDTLQQKLKGVEENPLISNSDKAAQSIPILQQLMSLQQTNIAAMQTAQSKLTSDSEVYWQLQGKIAEAMREQAQYQTQLAKDQGNSSFVYQLQEMAARWGDVKNAAQDVGNLLQGTLQTGMDSVANNMAKVIEGTETWRKALVNIAESALNQLLTGIIQVIEKLLVQLAIDIAIKAVTGGAFAEGGRPDVGKVALVGERGPELFVPDTAGTIIPAHETASILQGRGDAGGYSPTPTRGNTNNFHFWDSRPHPADYLNSSQGANHIIQIVRGNRQRIGVGT
jgi:hypothetical protein